MKSKHLSEPSGIRDFIKLTGTGIGAGFWEMQNFSSSGGKAASHSAIQKLGRGEEKESSKKWIPVLDRKIQVGIIGYGTSEFCVSFDYQKHPNVEVYNV